MRKSLQGFRKIEKATRLATVRDVLNLITKPPDPVADETDPGSGAQGEQTDGTPQP